MRTWAQAAVVVVLSVAVAHAADTPDILAPRADHHQHILSPAVAQLWSDRLLPAPTLPKDVAALVAGLEKSWNDEAGLAPLYAEDSVLVEPRSEAILRGRAVIAARLSRYFRAGYKFVPSALHIDGNAGYLTLYLTRPRDGIDAPFAETVISVRRGVDRRWQVVTQTMKIPGPQILVPFGAKDLVDLMDQAGIRRAVVLSAAYGFSDKDLPPSPDEYAKVRAENDWTAQQVAQFPDRLVGLCGLSPIKDYAVDEVRRCANELHMRGLKMHLGNSGVDVAQPDHLARLQAVFREANRLKLAIVVHIQRGSDPGVKQAEIILNEVLPLAPDIVVQIAHMAGSGPGWNDEALGVFAEAVAKHDSRTRRLYFDLATVAEGQSYDRLMQLAKRIRQIGTDRILYGSDSAWGGRTTPRQQWGMFQGMTPLSEREIEAIANNVAPYLK